jgi:hypothetical protein
LSNLSVPPRAFLESPDALLCVTKDGSGRSNLLVNLCDACLHFNLHNTPLQFQLVNALACLINSQQNVIAIHVTHPF